MRRIIHLEHHEKTVKLRFRQRECSLRLNRVLCNNYEERKIELSCIAVDRNLLLLHTLEKARLGSRSRAVDLICQKDISKDRTFTEHEFICLAVEIINAGEI